MSLQWVPKSNGEYVDSGGVHAGVDSGNELYVARAYHDGAIVPGKLHVSHSSVYIPYNMSEVSETFVLSGVNLTTFYLFYRFPYKTMRFDSKWIMLSEKTFFSKNS